MVTLNDLIIRHDGEDYTLDKLVKNSIYNHFSHAHEMYKISLSARCTKDMEKINEQLESLKDYEESMNYLDAYIGITYLGDKHDYCSLGLILNAKPKHQIDIICKLYDKSLAKKKEFSLRKILNRLNICSIDETTYKINKNDSVVYYPWGASLICKDVLIPRRIFDENIITLDW